MRISLGTLILFIMLSLNVDAEIKLYESTDNVGQNKKERIDSVESYLIDFSKSLKTMENKMLDHEKKMGELENRIKAMGAEKGTTNKPSEVNPGEKKGNSKETAEIEKLKADILVLKNNDIENLKVKLQETSDTVKALQATIKEMLDAYLRKEDKNPLFK